MIDTRNDRIIIYMIIVYFPCILYITYDTCKMLWIVTHIVMRTNIITEGEISINFCSEKSIF